MNRQPISTDPNPVRRTHAAAAYDFDVVSDLPPPPRPVRPASGAEKIPAESGARHEDPAPRK